jgi:hypothetical protein
VDLQSLPRSRRSADAVGHDNAPAQPKPTGSTTIELLRRCRISYLDVPLTRRFSVAMTDELGLEGDRKGSGCSSHALQRTRHWQFLTRGVHREGNTKTRDLRAKAFSRRTTLRIDLSGLIVRTPSREVTGAIIED